MLLIYRLGKRSQLRLSETCKKTVQGWCVAGSVEYLPSTQEAWYSVPSTALTRQCQTSVTTELGRWEEKGETFIVILGYTEPVMAAWDPRDLVSETDWGVGSEDNTQLLKKPF